MLDELQSAVLAEPRPVPLHAPQPEPEATEKPLQPETNDLQIPQPIWHAMWGAYTLFFGGLFAAVGHEASALFMLAISIAYTLMYFGTASVLFGLNRPHSKTLFEHGMGPLQTWTGPMSRRAVAGQILAVPLCLALFGVSIAIIARAVGL